jgi:hypothetical protein
LGFPFGGEEKKINGKRKEESEDELVTRGRVSSKCLIIVVVV